jgi:hypothetical protein
MSENGMFGAKGSGDTSGFGGLVNTSSNVGVTQRPFGSYLSFSNPQNTSISHDQTGSD